MRASKVYNPKPRALRAVYLPSYADHVPDTFDVVQFSEDTGLSLADSAELLSAAVADDFI